MTTQRKNITQPADYWLAFEAQAEKEDKTLSEWIGDKCLASLPPRVRKQLGDRPPAHRPKNTKQE